MGSLAYHKAHSTIHRDSSAWAGEMGTHLVKP